MNCRPQSELKPATELVEPSSSFQPEILAGLRPKTHIFTPAIGRERDRYLCDGLIATSAPGLSYCKPSESPCKPVDSILGLSVSPLFATGELGKQWASSPSPLRPPMVVVVVMQKTCVAMLYRLAAASIQHQLYLLLGRHSNPWVAAGDAGRDRI